MLVLMDPEKKAESGKGGGGGGGNWEERTHGPNLATSTPFQTEIVDFPHRIEDLGEKIDTPYHSSKTDMTAAIPYRNVSYRIAYRFLLGQHLRRVGYKCGKRNSSL